MAQEPQERERWEGVGALAALAVVLGYADSMIPLPVPGAKLGLANIAILLALAEGDAGASVCVALVKAGVSALLSASPVALALSLSGTALSLAVCVPLSRLRTLRLEMLSIAGALAHAAGQLACAQLLLGTRGVWYLLGPLAACAIPAGWLCGAVARRSLEIGAAGDVEGAGSIRDAGWAPPAREGTRALDDRVAILGAIALMAGALCVRRPISSCAMLAVTAALAAWARVGIAPALRTMRRLAPLAVLALAMHALFDAGEAVAAIGPVTITREGLVEGVFAICRLLSLSLMGMAYLRAQGTGGAMRGAAWLARPARRLGARLDGPRIAAGAAWALIPRLAAGMAGEAASLGKTPRAWLDSLPRLVARARATSVLRVSS